MNTTIRAKLIEDLAKDLLGPRHGSVEIVSEDLDPRQEYQVGQLFPRSDFVERDPDADAEILGDSAVDDDGEEEVSTVTSSIGQNFRRNPSSMGISYSAIRDSEIRICVTWARYKKIEGEGWKREPKIGFVNSKAGETSSLSISKNELQIDIKRSVVSGNTRVTVFLSSLVKPEQEGRVKTEELIFQPEIRLLVEDTNSIVEMSEGGFASSDEEWRISMRQYDDRRVLARGHLCGVYWREIDPQQDKPYETHVLPFHWLDGQYFLDKGKKEVEDFFYPALRSDFLPMYSAPSPEYQLKEINLDLDAEILANSSMEEELEPILDEFLKAYKKWIKDQSTKYLKSVGSKIDIEILARHERALERMSGGVEFLMENSNARLAFNFMNAAMNLQTKWSRGGANLKWRPFQIGFILLTLKSSVLEDDPDRSLADILWFPTGGGKSEAYLGLASFVSAYRRLVSESDEDGDKGGGGTAIISRYTLRLLTIQQFRRALRVFTAMEYLRVANNRAGRGWLPKSIKEIQGWIWGREPFSIGLWVGGRVTPNKLKGEPFRNIPGGALSSLKKLPVKGESDPAQVLNCPRCNAILAIPVNGLSRGQHTLHLFSYKMLEVTEDDSWLKSISSNKVDVRNIQQVRHSAGKLNIISIEISLDDSIEPGDIQKWWKEKIERTHKVELVSFNSPIRPGYIPVLNSTRKSTSPVDYEIRCPNPKCEIHRSEFQEKIPSEEGYVWKNCHPLFSSLQDDEISIGIPIQAITVDEKLYRQPPTMVVGTCDKLAILPSYEDAETASIFGRVRSFHPQKGYSQERSFGKRGAIEVQPFLPPSLVIQDELHLLDGPLGSAFGLYETILNELSSKPKYVASSATIRNSREQVRSIMSREAQIFPPVNCNIGDGFFLKINEAHALSESDSGRLFLGIAAPGKAAQTPIVRIWSRLLQTTQELLDTGFSVDEVDYFWTVAGYFNAIRELAGGEALWRQDIPDRIKELARLDGGLQARDTSEMALFKNLSSQTDSSELPGILASLERKLIDGDPLSGVAATSMFGTGVDVDRLSLMVVHGQPKSSSSYIQAVGRIGRKRAGLAVVFLRAGKPRDLNHYEFFTGYHRRLSVAVEPISVKPLAPRAIERILGPLMVMLLRNQNDKALRLPSDIWKKEGAKEILNLNDEVILFIEQILREKWEQQPEHRRPNSPDELIDLVRSSIDQWKELARRSEADEHPLKYVDREKKEKAVLGEPGVFSGDFAFRNAPTSLREVESTIKVYTRDW